MYINNFIILTVQHCCSTSCRENVLFLELLTALSNIYTLYHFLLYTQLNVTQHLPSQWPRLGLVPHLSAFPISCPHVPTSLISLVHVPRYHAPHPLSLDSTSLTSLPGIVDHISLPASLIFTSSCSPSS